MNLRSILGLVMPVLLLVGCASSTPRGALFPRYYERWETAPPELRSSLDDSREEVVASARSVGEPEPLIRYARAADRLARWQGDRWLELASSSSATTGPLASRVRLNRQRFLTSSSHALSLYRQAQYAGHEMGWRDHMSMAWLYAVAGMDVEAQETLAIALEDQDLDVTRRAELEALLMEWQSEGADDESP